MSPQDARIAGAVGIGAGIGAIFRAPLGGAVLGTEILYRDDLEPEALFPSLVASIVGFSIFGTAEGFVPIFGTLRTPQFDHPVQLLYYALLGLVAGLVGRLYARGFYSTVRLTHRVPGPAMLKPAAAGVVVGLVGLAVPQALGTGYGWLQVGMRDGLPDLALWTVLALPVVKILTTSLSIGSGGSGGIFGPGMVVGGFVGLGVWRLLHGVAPGMPDAPAPFMVVGMISCFGSIARAPLGLMLMVAEMTGSLVLPSDVEMDEARRLLEQADVTGAPLVHPDGRFAGVVSVHPSVATVGAGSPFAGVPISHAPWPAGGVAMSIDRGGHLIAPRGDTLLQRDDVVVAVVPRGRQNELRGLLEGEGSERP